jgi:ESCRT-I complex subunit VPS28
MGENKLYDSSKERDQLESLADFFSIIKATDLLEAAYSRDAIKDNDYAEACSRLITQFKNSERVLIRSGAITDVESFFRNYSVDCPRAYERLIIAGVPATVMHPTADTRAESVLVAETVQAFITTMDALKLGQKAVG